MAWRNVWRNARRSIVTMAATGFALCMMILYSGLLEGMLGGMSDDVLDYEIGEIQVTNTNYRDDPSLYEVIDNTDAALAALEGAGFTVTPRLMGGGLGASGDFSAGINLIGLDVARDTKAMKVSERLATGEWLDPNDPKGVVVGVRLARILDVQVGDELIVLSQGTDGSMANDLYRVRGVLSSVGAGADRAGVFMTQQAFRDLLVTGPDAHQIIVRVPNAEDLAGASARIKELLPDAEVITWRELMPTVAQMLDGTRSLVVIVFFIVYIAIGILILNAMLMAVFERISEFGVMKAIGVGPLAVAGLIAIESLIQTSIAVVAGLLCAVPLGYYLANNGLDVAGLAGTSMMGMTMPPVWVAEFSPQSVLTPLVVLVVIISFAVVYPAFKAARIQPVEAMRYR